MIESAQMDLKIYQAMVKADTLQARYRASGIYTESAIQAFNEEAKTKIGKAIAGAFKWLADKIRGFASAAHKFFSDKISAIKKRIDTARDNAKTTKELASIEVPWVELKQFPNDAEFKSLLVDPVALTGNDFMNISANSTEAITKAVVADKLYQHLPDKSDFSTPTITKAVIHYFFGIYDLNEREVKKVPASSIPELRNGNTTKANLENMEKGFKKFLDNYASQCDKAAIRAENQLSKSIQEGWSDDYLARRASDAGVAGQGYTRDDEKEVKGTLTGADKEKVSSAIANLGHITQIYKNVSVSVVQGMKEVISQVIKQVGIAISKIDAGKKTANQEMANILAEAAMYEIMTAEYTVGANDIKRFAAARLEAAMDEINDVIDQAIGSNNAQGIENVNLAGTDVLGAGVSNDPNRLVYDDDCYSQGGTFGDENIAGYVDANIAGTSTSVARGNETKAAMEGFLFNW